MRQKTADDDDGDDNNGEQKKKKREREIENEARKIISIRHVRNIYVA